MSFIHSIKFRFTIWYLLVLAVLLCALSTGVYFYLSRSLYNSLDSSLELRSTQLERLPDIIDSIRREEFQEELGEIVLLCFYSGDELVMVSPRDVSITLSDEFVEEAIAGKSSFTTIQTTEGEGLRLLAVPFTPGPGVNPEPAALVIGHSTKEIEQALDRLVRILIIAVPLTLVLAGAGGVFLARRALKPVDEIAQTARAIEESDLSQRIKVRTKDELGRLASTLNQMIERLEKAFKRQREFTGDASHELRAPLAVIQAESTLALHKERSVADYQQSLETIAQEAERMSVIIGQLLTLARADAGKEQLAFEAVDLGQLIGDLSSHVETLCQEKGLEFHWSQKDTLVTRGDKARLREMFLNLLDNAIRYTPTGGKVSVSLRREGQMAIVAVTDTGIGIPADELPHIFERFYRVDKARSRSDGGSGLGLAICKHITEVHGGRIEVESQVGKGSTFSVYLPLLGQNSLVNGE
jgi:heavy metal sensor kinase